MISLPAKGYEEIIRFVPQRAPMLMFESLEEADDQHAVTTMHVSGDNIFCRNAFFTVPGIIENIAQTAAAHNGYMTLQSGSAVRKGFIAVVKNLTVHRMPAVGEKLKTEIVIKSEVMNYVIVSGYVKASGVQIADCELRIFIPQSGEKTSE
jgi:predicted hotdog family 3-hydroxylacyl-ACP dehydratase